MVIYQFSNLLQIIFIVFFSILLLASIIVGIACFPMLKFLFHPENSIKSKIVLSFISVSIYVLCISILVLSAININEYCNAIKNKNLDNCNIVEGEVEDIIKVPQYSRGADLISYHISFTIDGDTYYIDSDIGVVVENIKYWNNGEYVTVYYKISDDRNRVIRVERQ